MHKVLARKYRPKQFADVIGQAHIVQALSNALNQQYLHHAYLFTGTRGVGKTTIARILAKCLNCEKAISATACAQCSSCQEIDEGRFPDLYEVDAASRTKVEDTRELLDNVQYAPVKGRYKIYIIDEVHMLSGHSFNALLKTLEEPPPHVKFLLATTDPQKLPATVLSRCLQFHLTPMTVEEIAGHLAALLQQENLTGESEALNLLAAAAQGSMRDALSLLDQSIAYGNGQVFANEVKTMLGTIDQQTLFNLLTALSEQDANGVLQCSEQLTTQGVDFNRALADLLSLLHQISVQQFSEPPRTKEALKNLATKISREDVQLYYQIGSLGQRDLPFAPSPRVGFEMTLLRMLAFVPKPSDLAKMKPRNPTNTALETKPPASKITTPEAAHWNKWLPNLKLTGATLALAQQLSPTQLTNTEYCFNLESNHQPLLQPQYVKRLKEALTQYINQPITVNIEIVNKSNVANPANLDQQRQTHWQQAAEKAILQDPNVQRLVKTFDATVIKETISPTET